MRRLLVFAAVGLMPLSIVEAQAARLHHQPVDSIVGCVRNEAPAFNRNRFYFILCPDTLALYDIDSKRVTRIGPGRWGQVDVSRDGSFLAFARPLDAGKHTYVWTLPLNPATGLPSGPPRRASMSFGSWASISPDSKWIAFAADSSETRLTVIPANGGQERNLYNGPGDVWEIQWSPNGKTLYFGSDLPAPHGRESILRVPAAGGKAVIVDGGDHEFMTLSPDGTHLVARSNGWPYEPWVVLDTAGHRVAPTLRDTIDTWPAWIARDVLLGGPTSNPTDLHVFNLESMRNEPFPLPEATEGFHGVQWAPDGRRFAAIRMKAGAGDALIVASSGGAIEFTFPVSNYQSDAGLVWSPNGTRLAYVTRHGQSDHLMIKDVSAAPAQELPVAGTQVSTLHWAQDGQRLLYFSGEPSDTGLMRQIGETGVVGKSRVVRRLSTIPLENAVFSSDTTVVAITDSAAFTVSLTSTNIRRLYAKRTIKPTVSPRGDLIAMRPPGSTGARYNTELIRPDGTLVQTVSFPGIVGIGVSDHFIFTPDGKSLIASARDKDKAGKCCVVYQAYFDGRPTRKLVDASIDRGPPVLQLSPDGKRLLYSVARGPVRHFELITIPVDGNR